MARIKDPLLFTGYFGTGSDPLDAAGLIDRFVDVDTEKLVNLDKYT
ncbi:hypothetical protein [Frigidibacter oleivorans]|nr:hypothetical protein [Frigidibacter oleivorans]